MPGFDGTGPRGLGTMMGRGRGYCLSYVDNRAAFASGQRRGAGRGRGYCPDLMRRGTNTGAAYAPPVSHKDELELLRAQVGNLENALEVARKRVRELESESKA